LEPSDTSYKSIPIKADATASTKHLVCFFIAMLLHSALCIRLKHQTFSPYNSPPAMGIGGGRPPKGSPPETRWSPVGSGPVDTARFGSTCVNHNGEVSRNLISQQFS
jgi:hypothetical protein